MKLMINIDDFCVSSSQYHRNLPSVIFDFFERFSYLYLFLLQYFVG